MITGIETSHNYYRTFNIHTMAILGVSLHGVSDYGQNFLIIVRFEMVMVSDTSDTSDTNLLNSNYKRNCQVNIHIIEKLKKKLNLC